MKSRAVGMMPRCERQRNTVTTLGNYSLFPMLAVTVTIRANSPMVSDKPNREGRTFFVFGPLGRATPLAIYNRMQRAGRFN